MRVFYLFLLLLCCLCACKPPDKVPGSSLTLLNDSTIQLELSPGHAPVETPLLLQLTAADVFSVSGELTGVSMYMGKVPLRFSQHQGMWQAEFLLGACSDPDMLWQLQLEVQFADGKKRILKQQLQSSWR
ncbi:hypothetical protein [Rheinheimera sp. EpRS3]|uniref:hypothetical protein n=1 Tax=Rheinheimera sp. EpRS3 TaxID=1712383 RepID=UPI000749D3BB|nr:hypothetical protein [Rheinheimera sp. EpRS3]KUM53797.1 hypothetical protein AR688_19270 [Rheinheimera sp. EpRS3]